MNKFKKLGLLLFIITSAISTCKGQTKKDKPNIIIILADDLGWGDVGFNKSDISTPNIDKLAREGMLLNHFYTAPICSPTRAGLMTGRYPNRFGLRETVIPPWSKFGVDTSETFLPEFLEGAGYKQRVALGKWHLGHASKKYLPLNRGFTHFYGHYNGAIDYFSHKREGELDWHNDWETSFDKGYSTDLITDEAVRVINKGGDEKSPFFLYIAYNAPHSPLQAKMEDLLKNGYDKSKPTFGNDKSEDEFGVQGRGNNRRQTYSAMVTALDRGVGRIMTSLKEKGIDQNTLILFFSDNGAAPNGGGSSGNLRGTKFEEWDGGVRAPAIAKWPNFIKSGSKTDQVMGYVDVVPTIINIAGGDPISHQKFDGLDMTNVLTSGHGIIERNLYLGYGSLVNNEWKIVTANSGNDRMKLKEDAIFDIMKDPSEKNNVKNENPEAYKKLLLILEPFESINPKNLVPPYGEGKKGFKAPKNWIIKNED
jgi:arylsulfatase B